MWYSYGNQMGSLEVIMDIPTKQVISSKWLPVRINEAAKIVMVIFLWLLKTLTSLIFFDAISY